jgi:signal transduction histidine kinase
METTTIKGDKELIKRMIENLIYNSINHNPKGCKITVTLNHYNKNRTLLTIKDNGCGVTKEQLKSFKKPIFKSNPIPEHGLGIRLVRQIASVHGWKVKFFNQLEGGFGCTITLPVIQ